MTPPRQCELSGVFAITEVIKQKDDQPVDICDWSKRLLVGQEVKFA